MIRNILKRKTSKIKVGLALGGGGARGIAHLGVLKVITEANIKVDYICGSSMGAFVGAIFALGFDLEKVEKEVLSFNKRKLISKFVDIGSPKTAILKGDKIYNYIYKFFNGATFKDVKIPFCVTATDLSTGHDIIIRKGDISKAILASISVPGIFPPIKINDKYLIDGGISNAVPVSVVDKMGADVVIAVDLMMKHPGKISSPNIITTLMQSYDIIRTQQIKQRVDKYGHKTIMIKPSVRSIVDSFRFHDMEKFIKSGEEAAKDSLPEIIKRLKQNKSKGYSYNEIDIHSGIV